METESFTNLDIRLARGHIEIRAKNFNEAKHYARSVGISWANKFDLDLLVFYPNSDPIRILPTNRGKIMNVSTISTIPGLFLGETKIYTRSFLLLLLDLCDRKDENAGIVRVSDNKQLILTSGASMGLEDATPLTRLHREDYWNLEDLAEFNREWRQVLRDDGSNSLDFTYRLLINPLDPNSGWQRQTTRYNLFVDGSELYHRAAVVDVLALH